MAGPIKLVEISLSIFFNTMKWMICDAKVEKNILYSRTSD
jgi:hypothetical protein